MPLALTFHVKLQAFIHAYTSPYPRIPLVQNSSRHLNKEQARI